MSYRIRVNVTVQCTTGLYERNWLMLTPSGMVLTLKTREQAERLIAYFAQSKPVPPIQERHYTIEGA